MPCVLKQRTAKSPGIVTFTQNEVLRGLLATSARVQEHVERTSRDGTWVYGVHMQGHVATEWVWPLAPWQRFFLWPDVDASFLRSVPPERRLPVNCINFIPDDELPARPSRPRYDVSVVTRPSPIKRCVETLHVLRGLLDLDPSRRFLVVAPDFRGPALDERSYELLGIERAFYELPLRLFSAKELKNISFICSPVVSFGRMPLWTPFLLDLIAGSKLLFLASHAEGTPRVVAEALLVGTPCAISSSLRSPVRVHLDDRNSIAVDDEPAAAAAQIDRALRNYDRFEVDVGRARELFGASANVEPFRLRLEELLRTDGHAVDGDWYLDDLHVRLTCHGQKEDPQLMTGEERFFGWLHASERDPYDEDAVNAQIGVSDWRRLPPRPGLVQRARRRLRPLRRTWQRIQTRAASP